MMERCLGSGSILFLEFGECLFWVLGWWVSGVNFVSYKNGGVIFCVYRGSFIVLVIELCKKNGSNWFML